MGGAVVRSGISPLLRHYCGTGERIIAPLKWEPGDSFEFIGCPTEEDLRRGEEFGARFARLIKGE